MQLLLTILATTLAAVLVVLVPGALLLATWRLDRVVPPPLVPATAFALGLLPLGTLTCVSLIFGLRIEFVAAATAVLIVTSLPSLARRARDERVSPHAPRTRARPRDYATVLRSFVAGDWLRGTPLAALALAVVAGLVATYVGFNAWNDSIYHIGQAQKLLALDSPSIHNTLQFKDGSAHPGYLVPLWHEAVALTAFVARVDPVTAAWIIPGLTFAISVLAFGGLGWVVFRSRHATSVVSAALVVTTVGMLPSADAIVNGLHPGSIALGILAPLVLAMLLTALWPADRVLAPQAHEEALPRTVTQGATFLAVAATAEVGLLHVGYLWVLGMGILGYVLVWALRAPWPRAIVLRHLQVGAAIAIVAVAVLALLLPGLNRLEGLGRDAQAELEYNDSEQYAGENGANLDALLRGDPAGEFHLRSDYLVLAGGLALLGLLAIPLVAFAPRWPGGWYLLGSALLVLAIALSNHAFPRFVEVVTLDQARRIERVLPLVLGLATAALAASVAMFAAWRRGGAMRIVGATAAVGLAAAGAVVVDAVPRLAGYGGERIVHPRVMLAALVLLAAAALLVVASRHVRRAEPASWTWPTDLLDSRTCTLALALLLVVASPTYGRLGDIAQPGRLENLPIDMRTVELRVFAPNVARELRKLPTGSTVLADPRSDVREAYLAMALAPVYVVSSVPRHTALTPENRVEARFELAKSFFEPGMSLDERRRFLLRERVDAIIVHPFGAAEAQEQLERMPGLRVGIIGTNQKIWLVDRSVLADAASKDPGRRSGS